MPKTNCRYVSTGYYEVLIRNIIITFPGFIDSSVSIERVVDILLKHIPDISDRKAYLRLYDELSIKKPSENAIDTDVIKLWLLTTPLCSWRELAWALFITELDSALVELKKVFIAGNECM